MSRLTAIVPQKQSSQPRLTVAPGVACYRSANMTEKRANAFAACLRGNRNFADATVHPTRKGSTAFYVAYLPTNIARQEDIFCRYQQEQIDRATDEMDSYRYFVSPHTPHLVEVTSLPDGKGHRDTYHVDRTQQSCTCPHYQFRLKTVGAVCKHLVAVAIVNPQPSHTPVREPATIAHTCARTGNPSHTPVREPATHRTHLCENRTTAQMIEDFS